jgi:DNA-binding XRE family transcriptional regulator
MDGNPSGRGETFGQLLRRLRTERNIGQSKLAHAIHFSAARLSQVENGDVPTLELAQACDDYLGAEGQLLALAEAMRSPKLWPIPAQLPVAVPLGLVGRDRELATLRAVADVTRRAVTVLAIDGQPGAGKTALALTLAQQISARHAGGVLYRDLQGFGPAVGPADPATVLNGFLLALGVSASRIPSDTQERAALYRSIARERPLLVVLDNAHSARQGAQWSSPAAANCPGSCAPAVPPWSRSAR